MVNQNGSNELMNNQVCEDDEIDLLDLAVVLAENWKLLVFGPLLIGVVALVFASIWPKTYESEALLSVSVGSGSPVNGAQIKKLAATKNFLEGVSSRLGLSKREFDDDEFRKLFDVITGRKDGTVTIRARGSSPEEAEQLAQAVIDELYNRVKPTGAALERLQQLLKQEKASLEESVKLEEKLAKTIQTGKKVDEALLKGYAELSRANSGKRAAIVNLEAQINGLTPSNLLGLTPSNLLAPPSLPEKPAKPKVGLITILAVVVSGIFLLLFVFIRHGLRSAATSPDAAEKIQRIRAAFGLRKG